MAVNYAYAYAHIDLATNMCIGLSTSSDPNADGFTNGVEMLVALPVYDDEYFLKFYINGNWYEDAEGTIPWTSSLL